MTVNIFEDRTSLLAYYEVQAAEYRMRHEAIFSEIKHYSWLISLLLASPVALLLGKERATVTAVLPYLLPVPFIGVIFSVLAFFIIRREFDFYNVSDARLLFIERQLGLTSVDGFLDSRLSKAKDPDFTVAWYSARERPLGSILPWKARIRRLFLTEFCIFALAGVVETGLGAIAIYR